MAVFGSSNLFQIGQQGNAWNNTTVTAGQASASIDIYGLGVVSVFGNVSILNTIILQFSQDNVNFYSSDFVITKKGDFGNSFSVGARYVRLLSTKAATITATISAKAG